MWIRRVQEKNTDAFEHFTEFVSQNNVAVDDLYTVVIEHLTSLAEYLDNFFPTGDVSENDWIRNPFTCHLTNLSGREQEQLADLSSDRTLQLKFGDDTLSAFWCSVANEYPLLAHKAMTVLLPFATTYLCEVSFSALANMKTKYRSRLNVENDLRLCLSNISPRIDLLCQQKQAHSSH